MKKHVSVRNQIQRFNILLFLAVAAFATACATSPTGRKQLSLLPDDQVNTMGVQAFDDMKKQVPTSKDPAVISYVTCVANEITNALPQKQAWEVVVFENPEPNAFALPGGKIGVHTGILKVAVNASQLGAVLGHEVGHVLSRHSNERLSEAMAVQGVLAVSSTLFKDKQSKTYGLAMAALGVGAQYGYALPHSRKQESEADVVGLDLMSKAGFDPRQAVELWHNMEKAGGGQPPEFLSTHPSNENRINELQARMGPALATYNSTSHRPSCAPKK